MLVSVNVGIRRFDGIVVVTWLAVLVFFLGGLHEDEESELARTCFSDFFFVVASALMEGHADDGPAVDGTARALVTTSSLSSLSS